MIIRKKKSNGFLYAGIKSKESVSQQNTETRDKKVVINRKLVVTVTSLKNGVGSSYTSIAISNFIASREHERVCLLHKGCVYVGSVLKNSVDSVYYPCNMGDIYSSYGYIVYDGGKMSEIDKNMLDRSDIKILLCWYNEEYIRLIGDMIKSRTDLSNWVFIFNSVPESKYSDVFALMEDYNVYCIPVFDAGSIDKQIKSIFNSIFYKKRK